MSGSAGPTQDSSDDMAHHTLAGPSGEHPRENPARDHARRSSTRRAASTLRNHDVVCPGFGRISDACPILGQTPDKVTWLGR
jgi:hypothetical protein